MGIKEKEEKEWGGREGKKKGKKIGVRRALHEPVMIMCHELR